MRRTVDFALDTEQMIRHRMATRGIGFEQAVNDSIRQGFDRGVLNEPFEAHAPAVGETQVHLDRPLQAVRELDDE